ncbi:Alpha-galactosylglucosyldiacylglycerol synthase [compost metagenome]
MQLWEETLQKLLDSEMETNKKILVYGYFGFETNQLDGQTIKTRSIYELLKLNSDELSMEVEMFDTQIFKNSKINLFKSWVLISKCSVLFYIPAHGNLKYLFPFIYLICKIKGIEIHYVVVGGWLSDFLKKLHLHKFLLKRIKRIYPQTKDLTEALKRNYGFENVIQLHNFRFSNVDSNDSRISDDGLRFVFMARVHPKKGIGTLFKLAEKLDELGYENIVIDIYGPIQSEYKQEFSQLLEQNKGHIQYCGIISPDNIAEVLRNYDLFLLPTEYYTEGFPGSVLDAYLSNVPVVVSKWKYAEEFVEDNKTGIIAAFNDADDFIEKVIWLINNPDKIAVLRNGVVDVKKKYAPEEAWKIIKNNI